MIKIYHNFGVPFITGVIFTLLKLVADQRDVTMDEANNTALDLVLVSLGALCVYYLKGRTGDANASATAGDAFLGVVLLSIRAARTRSHAKLPFGTVAPPVGILMGVFELLLGTLSILWTVKAV